MGDGLKRAKAAAQKTRAKWWWVAEYTCGCTADATRRKDLLEYCGKHGGDRKNVYKLPATTEEEGHRE